MSKYGNEIPGFYSRVELPKLIPITCGARTLLSLAYLHLGTICSFGNMIPELPPNTE